MKKNKINVIKPQLVAPIIFDWDSHYTMYRLGNSTEGRFSDLPDEIQVKDRIPFNRIRGMAVPIEYMMTEHIPSFKIKNYKYIPPYTAKQVIDYLKILKKVLDDYCVQNELYDLETQILLNDDNDVFRVIDEINHKKNILKK